MTRRRLLAAIPAVLLLATAPISASAADESSRLPPGFYIRPLDGSQVEVGWNGQAYMTFDRSAPWLDTSDSAIEEFAANSWRIQCLVERGEFEDDAILIVTEHAGGIRSDECTIIAAPRPDLLVTRFDGSGPADRLICVRHVGENGPERDVLWLAERRRQLTATRDR